MKIQTLSGFEALDEGRWNALLAASAQPSVFMTWQWQNAWLRAFGGGRPLQVLAASDATESLVALLPLHEAEAGLWRIVGGVDVSDYLDLIAAAGREEEAWEALLQHRAADRSAWHLRGIRAESPTAQRLHRLSRTGKAKFMDETMERFFRDALGALAAAGWIRLWFLDSAEVPVASFI